MQNTLVILMTVPWSFKLVYGFISDVCPIGGLRRKPYLVAGYFTSSVCYLALALTPQVLLTRLVGGRLPWVLSPPRARGKGGRRDFPV